MAFSMLRIRLFSARIRKWHDVYLLAACMSGALAGAFLARDVLRDGKMNPASLLCALPTDVTAALRLLLASGLFFSLLLVPLHLVHGLRLPIALAFFFGAVFTFSMTLCRTAYLCSGGVRSYFLSTAYLLLRFLGCCLCLHAAVRRTN